MKRPPPRETFRANLASLLKLTGWSNRELAARTNQGVSDRYIGKLLIGECSPTIDAAETIGQAFGLTGWDMITPNLDLELARSGRLRELVANYLADPAETRAYIDAVAKRDAK